MCASDFGQSHQEMDLKAAILGSEGRTIMAEMDAQTQPMYPEVTNAELLAAFGADLITLKFLDVQTQQIASLPEKKDQNCITRLRELTGAGIGISLEVTDHGEPNKRLTAQSLAQAIALAPDYLVLTCYAKPEVTPARIIHDIELVRNQYSGFLVVNPVVTHGRFLDEDNLMAYAQAGADLVILPAPGTVPGVSEVQISTCIRALAAQGVLAGATLSTSQEGADPDTVRHIALKAKSAGVDLYNFGDAGLCGIADPLAVQTLSLAVRGKRHTYIRMARSANR